MTTAQRLSQVFGIVFLIVGLAGFVVTGGNMDANHLTAPKLLGMFPVNALHNVVHLLFGVWGLAAYRSFAASRSYARIGGVAYLLLAVLGFVVPEFFGIMPIGGNDIWLHLLLGAVLAGVGFSTRDVTAHTTARV